MITLVELATNEDIEGPVESVFVIDTVSVSVVVFPSESLTVIVKSCDTVPKENWSASYNLLQT